MFQNKYKKKFWKVETEEQESSEIREIAYPVTILVQI